MFQRYIVVVVHWNTFFGDFRGFSPLRKKDSKGGTAEKGKAIRFRFSGEGTILDSLPTRGTAFTPPLLEFPYSPSLPKTLGIRLGKGKLLFFGNTQLLFENTQKADSSPGERSEEGTGYGLPSPCMNTR